MNIREKQIVQALIVASLLFATLPVLRAQERKIYRTELPPAVDKTVQEQSVGATIRGFSTELEQGQRTYEVELSVNGHGKDISMDPQGRIVEVEEEVAIDSLPSAVKEGLTRMAGSGRLSKVESITKGGKLVAYEAVLVAGKRRSEIQVGPDGKRLTHPE
jgi:hypothetical protein